MAERIYVLGGHQTDFAVNWSKKGATLYDIFQATLEGALEQTRIEAKEVQVAHVGNFTAELFSGQGQLGGFFASFDPAFEGLPTARQEAACASGSAAILSASADLEAGRYDVACVLGIEQERNVSGEEAAKFIGAAAWVGREGTEAQYLWPKLFSDLVDVYGERYGIDERHLRRIGEINFANAKRNPNAQTRRWIFEPTSFEADERANPVVEGRIRRHDCSQLTDGGAAIFLATERFASAYAERRGMAISDLPVLKGWGHRTAPMLFSTKMERSKNEPYVFPHVRGTIQDALRRAELPGIEVVSGIETHDCFTITEYMAIEHFGLTPPGQAYRAVEEGDIEIGGKMPVNASGGLIGLGHPVGATGVRMVLDAHKQVTGAAGDYQIPGATDIATLNIGGSATTSISFVIGKG